MAPRDASKTSTAASEAVDTAPTKAATPAKAADSAKAAAPEAAPAVDTGNLDTIFSALKTLMTTVDKLQKSRQEVGDIKPLIVRMLDGELLSGDELDQLKTGVSGLSKLVRIYSDYQTALEKAQPAREILDTVLK
ncbi:hypothetical protein D0962_05735 [Leptolyngbyaceae cyanobacterium CCMR0082]|uniref:Uncharacterized protein n=1 Tax=Adonisia turfae CCMR0082 TaxID=2304604 RepID=A0A6M0S201_9CYAN|nr:hypothetical protein [Adonisia turfae]MDV3353377.1 hypothetical protein [Leptothoe sp. LEGE 181152]NEZ62280.1 hypothetical protein [Adonisia turfae CCMR0082]